MTIKNFPDSQREAGKQSKQPIEQGTASSMTEAPLNPKGDEQPLPDKLDSNPNAKETAEETHCIQQEDLAEENGHILFRSLETEDWLQTLQEERKARLASLVGEHDL